LNYKLSHYQDKLNSDTLRNEFIFYLKEKLFFNDKDIYLNKDRELNAEEQNLIQEFIEKKKEGIPIDYILNSAKFYENDFYVDSRVLIPRPETEILVDYINNNFSSSLKVLDAGTGSGCIGISLALKNSNFDVYGSDYSLDSLHVAAVNKKTLDSKNFSLINANWLSCFEKNSFDLIVSNPPYIADQDPHLNNLTHEPNQALVASDDGLGDIKLIVEQSIKVLKNNGILILEHGYNQQNEVKDIFKANHFSNISTLKDFQSLPRITFGTLKS
jgi:release factor glutamine methyltransferase